jgi:PPOX class probable F420-dependent enzyme
MEPAHSPAPAVAASNTRLPDRIRAFLERPLVTSLATVDADGGPRQAVIWYRLDDDTILVNARADRRWPANLRRTGRAAFAICDPADPFSWVGITGRVTEVVDDLEAARGDIVALAHRYHDGQPDPEDIATFRTQQRVSFRVSIDAVHDHLED